MFVIATGHRLAVSSQLKDTPSSTPVPPVLLEVGCLIFYRYPIFAVGPWRPTQLRSVPHILMNLLEDLENQRQGRAQHEC